MKKRVANKQSLIRWKVYIDRAKMYIGYVQFFMIGFVFLKSYKDNWIGALIFDHLLLSLPILLFLFILLSLIVGRIDTMLGFREEELRNSAHSNPVTRELLVTVKSLKSDLAAMREEQIKNSK